MENTTWAEYNSLWLTYERARRECANVWQPGGACALRDAPVKCTMETCTPEKVASLRSAIETLQSTAELGRFLFSPE